MLLQLLQHSLNILASLEGAEAQPKKHLLVYLKKSNYLKETWHKAALCQWICAFINKAGFMSVCLMCVFVVGSNTTHSVQAETAEAGAH